MKAISKYLRANRLEVLITFCVLSNLFGFFLSKWLYYVGLVLIGWKMTQMGVRTNKNAPLFVLFLVLIAVSSVVNLMLDLRMVLFGLILVMTCPIATSLRWHLYKRKLLLNLFYGFVVVVLINLVAKLRGFNLRALVQQWEDNIDRQFSGYCDQPMWLSAAAAVATIFCAWLVFSPDRKTRWQWAVRIALLLASVYITMISGSRAAFVAVMVAVAFVIYLLARKMTRLLKYAVASAIVVFALSPFFLSRDVTGAMLAKQETQEQRGQTSRDELWAQRMAEFRSSPVIGVGFGAHGVGDKKEVSRVETGGGWISILAQTGILGLLLAVGIILKAYTPVRRIRRDRFMMAVYAAFLFFCFHSIVEGYMFQGGWYMCLVFWLVVGLLVENKQYGRVLERM